MGAKATRGPIGTPDSDTYRAEGGTLTRGFGVVQGTADDQAKAPGGAAARCLGVVDETTTVGRGVRVITHGECVAMAGGVIAAGDIVKMETEGDFIVANAADVETAGKARSSAAADGDEFILWVDPVHKRS